MWSRKPKSVNRLPDWVRDLKDTASKNAILSMLDHGAKLDEPREMIFTMYATLDNAKKVKHEVDSMKWHCSLSECGPGELIDPNNPTMNISIEIMQDGYTLNEENFKQDSSLFDELARKYNSVCDGWYASS